MRMYLTMPLSREQRWAMVRLTFGFVQMFGAAFALALLLWTGVTVWSLGTVVATGLVTGTSLVLFRRPQDRRGPSAERLSPSGHPEKKDLERRAATISKVQ
jgi:hypothetical protein